MAKMNALVFKEPGKIDFEQIPVPEITEKNQVVVKIAYCGICGSDVKIAEGKHAWKANVVLGHEFCGIVEDVGSGVTTVKIGDRIALDNNPRCGLCEFCRMGFSSQCVELKNRTLGVFQNGGYAQYAIAPEDVCFKMPDAIDDVTGTQIETLATVLNGMNTVQMQPWDTVLVLGFGPIGYLFSALANNISAHNVATEIDPFRRSVAEELGVDVYDPNSTDIEAEVLKLTNGKKFDIVIDAVGTQLENALNYVTPGGKILAFGMDSTNKATVPTYELTRRAVKVLGTYIGQNTMIPAIQILKSGKLNMKPFFTETVPLEHGVGAFNKLGLDVASLSPTSKQAMKIVLKP